MTFEAHDHTDNALAKAFDLAINRFQEIEGADVDDVETRARLTARLVVLSSGLSFYQKAERSTPKR